MLLYCTCFTIVLYKEDLVFAMIGTSICSDHLLLKPLGNGNVHCVGMVNYIRS